VERHGSGDRRAARAALRNVLRLDEDLSGLYALIAGDAGRRWAAERGAGRLLRAPTAFEDLLKLVLTTNCSWSLTQRMVTNLVEAAGAPAPLGLRAFPGVEKLHGRPLAFWRDEVRAGYRAPFLRDLVALVESGRIDVESWRDSPLSTEDLRDAILACPG